MALSLGFQYIFNFLDMSMVFTRNSYSFFFMHY